MTLHVAPDHRAVKNVEGGKERRRSMPDVIMGHRWHADIPEVAGAIARRNVHATAERDGEVRVVATHTLAFIEDFRSRAIHGTARCFCNMGERTRQALEEAPLTDERQAEAAEIILGCGETIGNLPIAYSANKWLTIEELRTLLASKSKIAVHVGEITYEDTDPVGSRIFDIEFTPEQDLLILAGSSEAFMHRIRFGPDGPRPSFLVGEFKKLLQTV